MTLGERIVFYRKQRKLTQKALAEQMSISPTRLNYWEKDKREPDVHMLNQLCRALDIDPKSLLSDDPGVEMMPKSEKTPLAPPEEGSAEGRVSKEQVEDVLVSLRIIQEGHHISDRDLRFINNVFDVIDMWFQNRS